MEMKKLILAVCMCMFLSVPVAYAACTAQDFQKEVMEFAKMAQTAAGDPAKSQEMLDKGCDLYGRMNKRLNEFK